ncbi:MAG: hypothetical protein ACYTBJ_27205, partial [Planctomycetota bacterium]
HALQTNPTLFIQSANQSATEWISFTHDQTVGLISAGTGLLIEPAINTDFNLETTGTGDVNIETRNGMSVLLSPPDAAARSIYIEYDSTDQGNSTFDVYKFADLILECGEDGVVSVGTSGAHTYASSSGDLHVENILEVGGSAYAPTFYGDFDTNVANQKLVISGTSITAAGLNNNIDISILPKVAGRLYVEGNIEVPTDEGLYSTDVTHGGFIVPRTSAQTNNSMLLLPGTTVNHINIRAYGDRGGNFGYSNSTDPTLIISSATSGGLNWMSLAHNGSDGVISGSKGLDLTTGANNDINFIPNGTGIVKVGIGSPTHLTPVSGELWVQESCEIDGDLYADGFIYVADNKSVYGTGNNFNVGHNSIATQGAIRWLATSQTPDTALIMTGSTSNAYVMCEAADRTYDFGKSKCN